MAIYLVEISVFDDEEKSVDIDFKKAKVVINND